MKIDELITFLANTDEPFAKVQAELTYGQDILKHLHIEIFFMNNIKGC